MIQCVVKSTNFAKKEMTFSAGGKEVVAEIDCDVFFQKFDKKAVLAEFIELDGKWYVTSLRLDLSKGKPGNPFGKSANQVEESDI